MTTKLWPRPGLCLVFACGLACAPGPQGGPGTPRADAGPGGGVRDAPASEAAHAHPEVHGGPPEPATSDGGDAVPDIDPGSWPQTPDAAPVPLPGTAQAIAGELHGAFLRVECASEEIELQYCHPQDRGIREIPLRMGGEFGRLYQITLKLWAVMETIRYVGGMAAGEHFYIDGQRETPLNAEYGLRIGARTYWLNHMQLSPGDHYTYGIAYTTPAIPVPGGATVTLFVRDADDFMNTNHMDSLPENVPPALQARLDVIRGQRLQGQFVYLEVTKVQGP